MNKKLDDDLEFLSKVEDKELADLVNCLIYDKDNEKRFAETLSFSEEYKKYGEKYSCYVLRITEELKLFGGNTIANLFRLGRGVSYKEIVQDVAKEMKIKFDSKDSVENIENKLILKSFEETWRNFTLEEQKKFISEIGFSENDLKSQGITAIAQLCLRMGGLNTYKLTLIVVNTLTKAILGRGLTLAGNTVIAKSISMFVGPVGWAFTGVWTFVDMASPAKRVTIPAVFYIALLRKQIKFREEMLEFKFIPVINSKTLVNCDSKEKLTHKVSLVTNSTEIKNEDINVVKQQFNILGLDYMSTSNEVSIKYVKLKEEYKSLKNEKIISEELYNEKIENLEKAYEIIEYYQKNKLINEAN